jgi:hypothetical protein
MTHFITVVGNRTGSIFKVYLINTYVYVYTQIHICPIWEGRETDKELFGESALFCE